MSITIKLVPGTEEEPSLPGRLLYRKVKFESAEATQKLD
jgi:hypothetical protein